MMMVLFYLARKRYIEEAAVLYSIVPLFRPKYTDDGFNGDRIQEVLKYFQVEIELVRKFGLNYDFSKYKSYRRAGRNSGGMSSIRHWELQIILGVDTQMLKTPIYGQKEFM